MRILIADDSFTMRSLVRRCLRQAGYDAAAVEEASDGAAALKLLLTSSFDLVLLDWNMPQMTAPQVLRILQQGGQNVRVVLVTTEGSETIRRQAATLGVAHIITKPFNVETFQATLKVVFASQPRQLTPL